MKEIISSILEAEKIAEQLKIDAQEKAKQMILEADARSEKIREQAITSFKKTKKDSLAVAEIKATEIYDKKIEDGEKQAEALKKDAEKKVDIATQYIIKEILG